MLINQNTAISTSKVLLVPYCKSHVARYHEWMLDPEIREATASEPLTLDEEHSMQQSWRKDSDKLTFIICHPAEILDQVLTIEAGTPDPPDAMVGDVNMFVSLHEESAGPQPSVIGELEVMIAERARQRRGFGKAALLAFLSYVLHHEASILRQFWDERDGREPPSRFGYFTAKIGKENIRSLALFDSLGFKRTSEEPNYWGEYEMRHSTLTKSVIDHLMVENDICHYRELNYRSDADQK